ncbi:MAG: DUF4397 domain-containing protein [Fimbriimonas sp.]
MMMKKLLSLAALAAVFVVAGCGGSGDDTGGFAYLRVINASPDTSADVFFQDSLFVDNLSFTESGPGDGDAPETIDSGNNNLVFDVRDGGEDVAITRNLNFQKDHVYTAIFAGFVGNTGTNAPRVIIASDNTADFNLDQANFRFVHASPAITTNVDVYVVNPDDDFRDFDPDASNVARYGVSNLIRVSGGTYRFVVTEAGTDNVLFNEVDSVDGGTYSTVVGVNDNSNEEMTLFGYGADF